MAKMLPKPKTVTVKMTNKIRCTIFSLAQSEDKKIIVEKLKKALQNANIYEETKPNIIIFVGGDGTFLRAVHHYLKDLDYLAFVGINTGRLGFFCQYQGDEVKQLIDDLLKANYHTISKRLLRCEIITPTLGRIIYGVNEIRLENPFHTLHSNVFINDEELEKFYGNGLCVSSTLGSTAYNKALGGAIIEHDVDLMQLSEIATIQNREYHALGSPLILGPKQTISLRGSFKNTVIGFDHLSLNGSELANVSEIKISLSDKRVKLINKHDSSFVSKLRHAFLYN